MAFFGSCRWLAKKILNYRKSLCNVEGCAPFYTFAGINNSYFPFSALFSSSTCTGTSGSSSTILYTLKQEYISLLTVLSLFFTLMPLGLAVSSYFLLLIFLSLTCYLLFNTLPIIVTYSVHVSF